MVDGSQIKNLSSIPYSQIILNVLIGIGAMIDLKDVISEILSIAQDKYIGLSSMTCHIECQNYHKIS